MVEVVILTNGSIDFALIGLLFILFGRWFKRGKKAPPPQTTTTHTEEQVPKTSEEGPKAEGGAEVKPAEPERLAKFASLEELVSAIGAKHLILFNQYGIPIESYNVREGREISISLADFISTMRKLSPDFDSMISWDGRKVVLSSIGKVGDIEVFALALSDSEMKVKADEVREFIKTYLSESLGRRK